MVKIRLKRLGNKFNAFYKIVAADSRAPRDGRFIEILGHYNPHSKELKVNKELVLKWLKQGAIPTTVVRNLLKKEEIFKTFAESK
ncbi:30S ribosomal protein S16 [Mesomycoplasma neurolyticum]|uniref:Small ribosomal subunit protein bS16 n=1 Tax=Mesomycoplasma neurolyticum TaxID=2120 RepID=A0A449A4Y9_9BACT|nr:30S ribosomal protein S16 [Mesomycoplasma neurolyticum]VEU59308.1 ribosomal protein S16 [Mesomycoplasma neurolyticum]